LPSARLPGYYFVTAAIEIAEIITADGNGRRDGGIADFFSPLLAAVANSPVDVAKRESERERERREKAPRRGANFSTNFAIYDALLGLCARIKYASAAVIRRYFAWPRLIRIYCVAPPRRQ